jgi:hypothetical protein
LINLKAYIYLRCLVQLLLAMLFLTCLTFISKGPFSCKSKTFALTHDLNAGS